MQTLLRAKGWIVPNYELAPDLESIEILRVVVRENMSEELVDRLVTDIVSLASFLICRLTEVAGLDRDHGEHREAGYTDACAHCDAELRVVKDEAV